MSDSSGAGVYAQANKPTVAAMSPFDALTQAAQTAQGINANRLFQARVALGQAQQQAVDPTTGQYDPATANRLLAQNPNAAPLAGAGIEQNQGLAGQQQTLQQARAGVINSMITPLLNVPDGQLHDAAASTLDRAVTQGLIPASQATAFAMKLPSDPTQLRGVLQQMQVSTLSPETRQGQMFGAGGSSDVGGFNVPTVTQSPMNGGARTLAPGAIQQTPGPQFINDGQKMVPTAGGQPIGPGIQTGLSPAQLATPTQIGTNSDGTAIMGTLGQYLQKVQPKSPMGDGRMPAGLLNPNKPQAAAASPASSQPSAPSSAPTAAPTLTPAPVSPTPPSPTTAQPDGGGITMGVGPAKQAALTAQGSASAAAFQQIADQGNQARSQNAILGNMLGDTSQFTSGTTGLNNFKATLQRQAPAIASAFGIDPAKVAANESFDKLAAQIAGQQGAGSDARLAVAQSGNPSSKLSQQGVDLILRQLQGNADYLQARAAQAAAYPQQDDRAGFESSVGSQLDPRAFQFQRMTQPQRVDYVKGLSKDDKTAVQNSYNYAAKAGLFAPRAPAIGPGRGY